MLLGPVYVGKRVTKINVSCGIKTSREVASVDVITVEIVPRDNIEALWIKPEKSMENEGHKGTSKHDYFERLIDVDSPLPDLHVILSPPTQGEERENPHVHEMNFTLSEAIDLLALQQSEGKEVYDKEFDIFATREWLDKCFWHVAASQVESLRTRKQSICDDEVTIMEAHELGVAFVSAILLYMHTGFLNPFCTQSNQFFHDKPSRTESKVNGDVVKVANYLKYVLLGYQVRYKSPGDGVCHVIRSDKSERVYVKELKTEDESSDKDVEYRWEDEIQQLVNIISVDRASALSALSASNGAILVIFHLLIHQCLFFTGDLNQAMESLLTKLDYN